MPKYQIVLESDKILSDQEFENELRESDSNFDTPEGFRFINKDFKILYAQNLEGIRHEIYKKRDNIIDGILHASEPSIVVEENFAALSKLFHVE